MCVWGGGAFFIFFLPTTFWLTTEKKTMASLVSPHTHTPTHKKAPFLLDFLLWSTYFFNVNIPDLFNDPQMCPALNSCSPHLLSKRLPSFSISTTFYLKPNNRLFSLFAISHYKFSLFPAPFKSQMGRFFFTGWWITF